MLTVAMLFMLNGVFNGAVQNQPLDRIVAVVEHHLITMSDIRNERLIRQVLGEPPRRDDRELLDDLIRERLIHAHTEQYPETEPPPAEIDRQLRQIQDRRGLSIESLQEAIRERFRAERLFSDRFGKSMPQFAAWIEQLKSMSDIEILNDEL